MFDKRLLAYAHSYMFRCTCARHASDPLVCFGFAPLHPLLIHAFIVQSVTVDTPFDLTLREGTGESIAGVLTPWMQIMQLLGGGGSGGGSDAAGAASVGAEKSDQLSSTTPKTAAASSSSQPRPSSSFTGVDFKCDNASVTYITECGGSGLQLCLTKVIQAHAH